MQILEVLQSLVSKTDITTSLIIGGKNKRPQARSLVKGTYIVVATHGRLADILRETEFVKYNCDTLVIDEAELMMKQGFFNDMTTNAKVYVASVKQFCFRQLLACMDLGARGLDIDDVNNVVQYDPPYDVDQYIHRAGKAGQAYLFLRDNDEYEFVKLTRRKMTLILVRNDFSNVNNLLRRCAKNSPELQEQGKAALISFIRSYRIHQLPCFHVTKLDLDQTAKTFLLNEVPEVEIMGKKKRKQFKKAEKIKKIKEDAKRKRKSDSTGDAEETPANNKKKYKVSWYLQSAINDNHFLNL